MIQAAKIIGTAMVIAGLTVGIGIGLIFAVLSWDTVKNTGLISQLLLFVTKLWTFAYKRINNLTLKSHREKAKFSLFKGLLDMIYSRTFLTILKVSLIICLIGATQKYIFSHLAVALDQKYLCFIFAMLLIRPLDIIRCNLLKRDDTFSWVRFLVPSLFIILLGVITYFDLLSHTCAVGLSFGVSMLPWNVVYRIMEEGSATVRGSNKMAMGGVPSEVSDLNFFSQKSLPNVLHMEGQESGSRKRSNPFAESEDSPSSKRTNVSLGQNSLGISPSSLIISPTTRSIAPAAENAATIRPAGLPGVEYDGCLPKNFYPTATRNILREYREAKLCVNPLYHTATDRQGFEFTYCPKIATTTPMPVGSSGSILYKLGDSPSQLSIQKITVQDTEGIITRGWKSDGLDTNQPAAKNFAEVLLAIRANGQQGTNSTMITTEEMTFLKKASGSEARSPLITDKLISALRLSK